MKNEVKIIFAVASKSSSIDQQSNTVSLFNILEDIQFNSSFIDKRSDESATLAIPFQFDFVILFARSDSSKNQNELPIHSKLYIIDPLDKILGETPFQGKIEKDKKRFRMTIKFNDIKATKSGTYVFRVKLFADKNEKDILQQYDVPVDVAINISKPKDTNNQ